MRIVKATFPTNPNNTVQPQKVCDLQPGEIFIPLKRPETANQIAPTDWNAGNGRGGYLPYLLVSSMAVNVQNLTYTSDDLVPFRGVAIPTPIAAVSSPFTATHIDLHWPYASEEFELVGYIGNANSLGLVDNSLLGTNALYPAAYTLPDKIGALPFNVTMMTQPLYSPLGHVPFGCISMLLDPRSTNTFAPPYSGITGIRLPELSLVTAGAAAAPISLTVTGSGGRDVIYPSDDYWPVYGNTCTFQATRTAPIGSVASVHVLLKYV